MEKRKANMNNQYYQTADKNQWHGRMDGNAPEQKRWWKNMQSASLERLPKDLGNAFVLLGFACDEGVKRNKGRIGAAKGPEMIRQACCNLPVHSFTLGLYDSGNIICNDHELEKAQEQLAIGVSSILEHNGFPLLLGGGHAILYGHYSGIRKVFPNKKIGIINFDAHFDLRPPGQEGASSGTGFYQIAANCKRDKKEFLYLPIGIQESGNTQALFDMATQLDVPCILAQDLNPNRLSEVKNTLLTFIEKTDIICLTVDMDVFSASIAPGVSAPAAGGIFYDYLFLEILHLIVNSGKMVSMDIAEVNPSFDIDNYTSRLAAQILFEIVKIH